MEIENLVFFNTDGYPLSTALIKDEVETYHSSRALLDDASDDTPSQFNLKILEVLRKVPIVNNVEVRRWQHYSNNRIDIKAGIRLPNELTDSDTPVFNGFDVSMDAHGQPLDWLDKKVLSGGDLEEHFTPGCHFLLRVYEDDELTPVDVSLFPEYSWLEESGVPKTFTVLNITNNNIRFHSTGLGNGTLLDDFKTVLDSNSHKLLILPISVMSVWDNQSGTYSDWFSSYIQAEINNRDILLQGDKDILLSQDSLFLQRKRVLKKYSLDTNELIGDIVFRYTNKHLEEIAYRGTLTWNPNIPTSLTLDGGVRSDLIQGDTIWISLRRKNKTHYLNVKNFDIVGESGQTLVLDSNLMTVESDLPQSLIDEIKEINGYSASYTITPTDLSNYIEDPFVFSIIRRYNTSSFRRRVQNIGEIQNYIEQLNAFAQRRDLGFKANIDGKELTIETIKPESDVYFELDIDSSPVLSYQIGSGYTTVLGSITDVDVYDILINEKNEKITDWVSKSTPLERVIDVYDADMGFINNRGVSVFINGEEYNTKTSEPDLASSIQDWFDEWSEVLKHRGVSVSIQIINTESGLVGERNITRLHFVSRYPNNPLDVEIREPIFVRYALGVLSSYMDVSNESVFPTQMSLNIGSNEFKIDRLSGEEISETYKRLLENEDLSIRGLAYSLESQSSFPSLEYEHLPVQTLYWGQATGDGVLITNSDPAGSDTDITNSVFNIVLWSSLPETEIIETTTGLFDKRDIKPLSKSTVLNHNRVYAGVIDPADRGVQTGTNIIYTNKKYPLYSGTIGVDDLLEDNNGNYILISEIVDTPDWSDAPLNNNYIYPLKEVDEPLYEPSPFEEEDGVKQSVDTSLSSGEGYDTGSLLYEARGFTPSGSQSVITNLVWELEPEDYTEDNDFFFIDLTGNQINIDLTDGEVPYRGRKPMHLDGINRFLKGSMKPNTYKEWENNPYRQMTEFPVLNQSLRIPDGSSKDWEPSPLEVNIGYFPKREGAHSARLVGKLCKDLLIDIKPIGDPVNGDWGIVDGVLTLNNPRPLDLNKSGLEPGDIVLLKVSRCFEVTGQPEPSFKKALIKVKDVTEDKLRFETLDGEVLAQNGLVGDDFTYCISIDCQPQKIFECQLLGQTVGEDERLDELVRVFKPDFRKEHVYAVRSYDVEQMGVDFNKLNIKRKELMDIRTEIEKYIGSYRALRQAVFFFEHTELEWFEYFLDTNPDSVTYNRLLPVELDKLLEPQSNDWEMAGGPPPGHPSYRKLAQTTLTYRITDDNGRLTNNYTMKQVLIQLGGLRKWLQRYGLPMNVGLREIAGRAITPETINVTSGTIPVTKLTTTDEVHPVLFSAEAMVNPLSRNKHLWVVVINFKEPDVKPDHYIVKITTYKTADETIPLDPGFDPGRRDAGTGMETIQQIKEMRTGEDYSNYQFAFDRDIDHWALVETIVRNGQGQSYVSKAAFSLEEFRDF